MIKPTIGRVVLFHPEASSLHPGDTHAALVTHVWSDTCVNLAIFDSNGVPYAKTSVFLYQGEGQKPTSFFAEWMPYQKAVAAGEIPPTLHATP